MTSVVNNLDRSQSLVFGDVNTIIDCVINETTIASTAAVENVCLSHQPLGGGGEFVVFAPVSVTLVLSATSKHMARCGGVFGRGENPARKSVSCFNQSSSINSETKSARAQASAAFSLFKISSECWSALAHPQIIFLEFNQLARVGTTDRHV